MLGTSIIGIDLGGTKIAVSRYDAKTWKLETEERLPTHADQGLAQALKDLVTIVQRVRTPKTKAVGVGVAGLVRQSEGIILKAPNIAGSHDVPLKELLSKELGLPVFVDNDANCFALAEAKMGVGKGKKVVVGITFGTGVGGGIVLDGKIFHGAHGYAAEFGHTLLVPGQLPYESTDRRGSVEQYLSGTAFGKRCTAAKHPKDYLEGEVCSFLQPQIFREVAWFCTTLGHLLDPDIIVFGGSAGHAMAPHLDKIRSELQQWMLPGSIPPQIAIAAIENAGSLGAALLAA